MKEYAVGVDIGGTMIKTGLFRTDGELLDTWAIPTRTEDSGAHILEDMYAAIREKLDRRKIPESDVEGIGMGVPGPVGSDGTVYQCVNLGWDVFNIEERMEVLTGWSVKAGNDGNVAALGEMYKGGGRGHRNVVMVTLGTGIGGGIVIDGHILPGGTGAAGEVGHMPMLDDEEEFCRCGKKGCLEQYASATGVARMARKHLETDTQASMLRNVAKITAKDVFDAAKKGDSAALAVVEQFGRILGKGLAQTACVVNPEVIVIGGGMSKAGEILLETVRSHFRYYAFHAVKETQFKLAELGNQAGIYGGVRLVLE